MDSEYLFTLVPLTAAATRIVNANKCYHEIYKGTKSLSFKTSHRSRFPGRLISFGCQPVINDVILPDDESPTLQCSFYLLSNGELMLEDATTGHHTRIIWEDNDRQHEKYSLEGDPRSRIIPLANPQLMQIVFGAEVSFQFKWRLSVDSETSKKKLSSIARAIIASNQGMTIAEPRDSHPHLTRHECRTFNTPNVPAEFDDKPPRQIHEYDTIDSGAGWECVKAVDLRTGRIWAVKGSRNPEEKVIGEPWKAAFTQEVETLAQLSHRNIIRLEHHQGWSLGPPVQIFFPLYKGTVRDLLHQPHRCFENPSAPESWVPSFISQTLAGLAFIHKNNMVHRDIMPENIVYDNGGPNNSKMFYISGFGLTVPKEFASGGAGSLSFLAPETTRYSHCDSASDVYAFGVTLLEVTGKYCISESRLSTDEWRAKLKAFNAKHYASYRDVVDPEARLTELQPGHSRIQSLIDNYVVRKSLNCVLEQDPKLRATASEACRNLLVDYPLVGDSAPAPKRGPTPGSKGGSSQTPKRDRTPGSKGGSSQVSKQGRTPASNGGSPRASKRGRTPVSKEFSS
ncbi:hypothetical protein V495_02685 [Pseudogymnoascus sp. VKM F-4514 (FW-929)]|nr:hypothetical protein V495_02685 [Pseudogymnoascus sp. VKM F-4514 (FW-929)]KFY53929.1 hypothetical protein V497_08152 [Pseudogymnoascus sp. VKM F-4516 (FW-969)]